MQLMMIFGWTDPKQAVHYTRKARQKKRAGEAMGKLAGCGERGSGLADH